jgi:hypothetical protein
MDRSRRLFGKDTEGDVMVLNVLPILFQRRSLSVTGPGLRHYTRIEERSR